MSVVSIPTKPPLDTLWKILPKQSTQFEKDLLKITATDYHRELMLLVPKVKTDIIPDSWLPYLLIEYGFAEVAKYYKNWRKLLQTAKELRGYAGTPFAIEEMARLMRYENAALWEHSEPTIHFPEFQLNLGEYEQDLPRIATLRKMVNAIKPLHTRFRRVFHGWDDRQSQWDETGWGEMWDGESGVDILPLGFYGTYRSDDQFLVSLGTDYACIVELPEPILITDDDFERGYPLSLTEEDHYSFTSQEYWPRLDVHGWDDLIERLAVLEPVSTIAQFVIPLSSGDVMHEYLTDGIVFAEAYRVVLDETGFDGPVPREPVTTMSHTATLSDFELFSGPELHDTEYSAETSSDNPVTLDESDLDGTELTPPTDVTLEIE